MKLKVFSLFDVKAKFYGGLFVESTSDVAKRSLAHIVSKPGNQVSSHPEDFILYEIAEFDPATGKIAHSEHKMICKAVELLPNSISEDLYGDGHAES